MSTPPREIAEELMPALELLRTNRAVWARHEMSARVRLVHEAYATLVAIRLAILQQDAYLLWTALRGAQWNELVFATCEEHQCKEAENMQRASMQHALYAFVSSLRTWYTLQGSAPEVAFLDATCSALFGVEIEARPTVDV